MPAAATAIEFKLDPKSSAYKVVSVLQEQFKTPAKTKEDGTTTTPKKLQGRLLIGAIVESVLQHASAETLAALSEEVKDKGEGDKKGKASEYIAAIAGARAAAPAASVTLEGATEEQLKARLAALEAAKKAGGKTKDVAAL